MKYIGIFLIGIGILLLVNVISVIRLFKIIKTKKLNIAIGCHIAFIVILSIVIYITIISMSYDYSYMKGINLINEKQYSIAIIKLNQALSIRKKLGPFSIYLEKKHLGFPILFSSEEDVHKDLASIYRNLKDYKNAIKEYQEILAFDNANFDATIGMADILFSLRDFVQAKHFYKKAINFEPHEKNSDYYIQLGRAYMVLLDYDKAISYFSRALELGEKQDIVQRYLEICYEEIKKRDTVSREKIERK